MFFFFKQKTAYEMRISDWSSDVCSSDLLVKQGGSGALRLARKHLDPYGGGGLLSRIDNIVQQRYAGDINIFPVPSHRRMLRLFANPSADDIQTYIREGERATRSEEHTSELQSLMRISYAVFCLKKNKKPKIQTHTHIHTE